MGKIVLPPGFEDAHKGVLGVGGDALVRAVHVSADAGGWGTRLAPALLDSAWDERDSAAWALLWAHDGPQLPVGSEWALRLGYRGRAPMAWEGTAVAEGFSPRSTEMPGDPPLRWEQLQRLSGIPRVDGALALPVAVGWWTDEMEPGRRWWWTLGPLGSGATIATITPLTHMAAARWALDMLAGISAMHRVGLVHLDVSPGNVLIDHERARLMDFGTVRRVGGQGTRGSLEEFITWYRAAGWHGDISCDEPAVGTYGFAAPWLYPEWLRVRGWDVQMWVDCQLGQRADLYGVLGTLLFALERAGEGRSPLEQELYDRVTNWVNAVRGAGFDGDPLALPFEGRDAEQLRDLLHRVAAANPPGRRRPVLPTWAPHMLDWQLPRANVVRQLTDVFDDAVRNCHMSVLLVAGDAGTGKSGLLARLASYSLEAGAAVVDGGFEKDVSTPYGGLVRVVVGLLRQLTPSAMHEHLRGTDYAVCLLPAVRQFLDEQEVESRLPSEGEEHSLKAKLHEAAADLVRRVSANGPLLILIEDCHWADEAAVYLLGELVRQEIARPALLVMTYRAREPRNPFRHGAQLERLASTARQVDVLDLSEQEIAQLAKVVLDQVPPAGLAATIERHTGNAYHVTLILRDMRGDPIEVARVAAGGSPRSPSVEDAIRQQLATFPDDVRRILIAAALLGMNIDPEILRLVGPLRELNIAAALQVAESERLVTRQSGKWRFIHALAVDALLDEAQPQLTVLHGEVGDALVAHADRQGLGSATRNALRAEAALHLARGPANRAQNAAELCLEAANIAAAELAPYQAARLAEAGRLALANAALSLPELEVSLLLCAGKALTGAARRDEESDSSLQFVVAEESSIRTVHDEAFSSSSLIKAGKNYTARAAECARSHGLTALQVQAAIAYGGTMAAFSDTRDTKGPELIRQALGAHDLGEAGPEARVRLLGRLAMWLGAVGQSEEALAATQEALQIAEQLDDPPGQAAQLIADARYSWLYARLGTGFFAGMTDQASKLLRVADDVRVGGLSRLNAYRHAMYEMARIGNLSKADQLADQLEEMATTDIPHDHSRWQIINYRASRHTMRGEFEDAEPLVEDLEKSFPQLGSRITTDIARAARLRLRHLQGRAGECLDESRDSLRHARSDRILFETWLAWNLILCGDEASRSEAHDLVSTLAHEHFTGIPRNWTWVSSVAACSWVSSECHEKEWCEALASLLDVDDLRDTYLTNSWRGFAGSAQHHLGRLYAVMGDNQRAEAFFDAAQVEATRKRLAPWIGIIRQDRDRLLIRSA